MSKLNNKPVAAPQPRTAEGGIASKTPGHPEALRRAIMSCFLWEDQFYESGVTIADRVKALVPLVNPEIVSFYAIKAREDMKLRHAPLLLVREMARGPKLHRTFVGKTLERVVQRADELAEFLAIYWKDDAKQPLSSQVKKGLAKAFTKFNEYQLAKYKGTGNQVMLRDVMFLCHAKPPDVPAGRKFTKNERAAGKKPKTALEKLYYNVANNNLETPDTHEVTMSAVGQVKGLTDAEKDTVKKGEWERLLTENKLGALALLKNLRNMTELGVERALVHEALKKIDTTRVLPHRFIAAARYAPTLEHWLEPGMLKCAGALPKLKGRTAIMIDVSSSMDDKLSGKSDMSRMDAACGVAIIAREVCDDVVVATFSNHVVNVPPRRGFALRDIIVGSQPHNGTYLGLALEVFNRVQKYDRIIVITDEQIADDLPEAANCAYNRRYMINVASNKNGVGYGTWNKIDGFSEAVVRYITEFEHEELQ